MTDEQLLRAVRRVLGLVCSRIESSGRPATYGIGSIYDNPFPECDKLDKRAVAILRDEMDKANEENCKAMAELFPFVPHTDDDPTKSFVATTE